MADDDLQNDVNSLKTHRDIDEKKIMALEAWRKDAQTNLDSLNAERGDNAKIKWTQKLVDDLDDQVGKRIKALEDKVTALQKKVK